jgi:hypothetical protein
MLALAGSLTLVAQQRSSSQTSLKGVWRATEIRYTGPNARTVTNPQPWIVIVTDKHIASVGVTSDAARPPLPPVGERTDKHMADNARTFQAYVDTYELSSAELTSVGSGNSDQVGRLI